jgi:basic membrane protein A
MTIKDFINGDFNGGNEVKYSLLNDGIGYEKTDLIPKDVIDFVEGKINSK